MGVGRRRHWRACQPFQHCLFANVELPAARYALPFAIDSRVTIGSQVKQSKDYDSDGAYVRHWLPELAEVPAAKIHEPWTLSREEQQRYGVTIGVDYPNPPKSNWAGFDGGSKGGGKGGSKGGGGRGGSSRRGGGGYVQSTPAQAAAMGRGSGENGRGRGGKGGGGRKRVQHDFYD